MADRDDIRAGMQVLGSDGGMVGRVTGLHGDHLHVEPDAPEPGTAAYIVPRAWIARVDDHVHLNRAAALVRDTWTRADHAAGDGDARRAATDPPARGSKWVWILGAALLLLVLYLGVRGCDYAGREPDYENASGTVESPDT